MPMIDTAIRSEKPATKALKLCDGMGFPADKSDRAKWWRFKCRTGTQPLQDMTEMKCMSGLRNHSISLAVIRGFQ